MCYNSATKETFIVLTGWIESVNKPDLIIRRRPPSYWSLGEERDALLRGEEPQSDWETHIVSKILGKKCKRISYTIN